MKKVIFICHGNICRSPMAKYIFKYLSNNEFYVESRATSTEEIGNDIYSPIKKVLDIHNIPYDTHHAKQITKDELDTYDYIYVFDNNNLYNLKRMYGSINNIKLISDNEIDDPWYTRDFERAYQETYNACKNILDEIRKDK
ncbi:MAG: low molecular weight phosphotyrosine protein phosphatase [Bacilli bacterium]|nr:low molecular weight phosphotyrosine protein phosphatase [Bacilli bacterium]